MTRYFQLISHATGGVTASLETVDAIGHGRYTRLDSKNERAISVIIANLVVSENIAKLIQGEPLEMTRDPENAPSSEPMSRGRTEAVWFVRKPGGRNRGQKRRTFRDN